MSFNGTAIDQHLDQTPFVWDSYATADLSVYVNKPMLLPMLCRSHWKGEKLETKNTT